jgi:chorismate--pyruvate lyase
LNSRWRPAGHINRRTLPASIRGLLLESGSLTQQLEGRCPGMFNLEFRGQSWRRPLFDEARVLSLRAGACALIREIYLQCKKQPWVYGRSIIPAATFTGAERRLAHWGQRSLGDYLFSQRKALRGHIEIARILPQHNLFRLAAKDVQVKNTELWGRRSLFYIKNKPLLVVEVFLTDQIPCMNAGKN